VTAVQRLRNITTRELDFLQRQNHLAEPHQKVTELLPAAEVTIQHWDHCSTVDHEMLLNSLTPLAFAVAPMIAATAHLPEIGLVLAAEHADCRLAIAADEVTDGWDVPDLLATPAARIRDLPPQMMTTTTVMKFWVSVVENDVGHFQRLTATVLRTRDFDENEIC